MPAPYFHLLGHLRLASVACQHNSGLASALQTAGMDKTTLAEAKKLADAGEDLIDRKADVGGEDRIYEHNLHGAVSEVEMWSSTIAFRLKKALDDDALIARVLAEDVHTHNHTVTMIARALRTIAMMRVESTIHEHLGSARTIKDLIIRGRVLLNKVYRSGQDVMAPGSADDPADAVFGAIGDQQAAMMNWVTRLGVATEQITDQSALLGELGYVPEGVGLPMGGTSYGVPLHQKAQRDNLPDMHDLRPDPGWSAGRQGRNRENLGRGWVQPTFE